MENKELIKQLKSVGFEFDDPMDDSYMILRSEKDASFVRYVPSKHWLLFFKSSSSKAHYSDYFNTFAQILEAIKEYTGVNLTPKKSKREEIEELKTKVESLEDAIKSTNRVLEELNISIKARGRICLQDTLKQEAEELKTKVESLEDAIRSQNKVIEELNISKPLEVAKEIAKLALKLKEMELSKTFENGGAIGTAHGGESVLSKAILDKIRTPEKEQEKKAFKVDDRVVVVGNYDDARDGDIGFVITTPSKYAAPEYYVEFHGMITWVHEDNLEHAPEEQEKEKALEFGKTAELLYTIDSDYCEGAVVLVCDTMKAEGCVSVIVNGRGGKTIDTKYLKPL